jgi:hypothetical protein
MAALLCPEGHAGPFRYVEPIFCWRDVEGVDPDGTLRINAFYRTGEGYDDGDDENAYLECHFCLDERGPECMATFPVPADVVIEWT